MASAMLSRLQNLWPFSLLKTDDLKVSKQLVHKLSIPEQTKQFVFALCEPSSQSVVYILAVQNLSEQSALDAECLIREVEPDAVVAQVTSSTLSEIQNENDTMDYQADSVPTSSFEVLKRCFVSKINKSQYENLAGNVVLREIFGVSFYGNFLAAKRAAKEVGSHFLLVESPYESACVGDSTGDNQTENQSLASLLPATYLIPRNSSSVISQSSKRFYLTDTIHSQKVKSLTRYMPDSMLRPSSSDSALESRAGECQPNFNYQAPPFAQSLYPLLADLHDMFNDLPAIRNALVHAQKMLADVNKGEPVKTQLLSEVHNFRFAVEGLRIALNDAARFPIDKKENVNSPRMEYNELPPEEKCHVLFAQALKNQTKNFKSSVAIVDAASLAGLRKHWNTPVPPEVAELAGLGFIKCHYNDNEETIINGVEKKGLLADKPMVAVGAGATAVIGASSLSKAVPASTLMKLVTYKLPVSLKLGFTHFQRTAALGISKILGSSKVLAPGVASAGAKASSTLKVTASSEKIRLVAHGIISFTERTSLLAMRTTFYQVMRNRHVRPAVFAPLTMFGCSMATCAGLLAYGDGIECAIESVPSAPMIASLGRGLQSLHQASLEVRQTNAKIQEALQSLMYNLNKMKPSKV